jgi:O-antigen ligase
VLTCAMTMYVAAIGVGEVIQQQDLLPLPDGDIYVAGDSRGHLPEGGLSNFLVRPNGPFSTNNTFAMNGLISFFLLSFLRRSLKAQMPGWQLVLHRIAMAAALAQAMMPFFRSVMLALVAVLMVDTFYQKGWRRALRVAAIVCLGSVFLLLRVTIPEAFEDRTDPENLYGRIAQQRQTLAMFLDHPWSGVGLNNFNDAAQRDKYARAYQGVESVAYPHNNLGAVLAETGLAGFVPFVLSQIFFFAAFWRLPRDKSPEAKLAWKAFLFIFLCYWINGMSLTIAYFGDMNLWYMLVLSLLYKFSLTSSPGGVGELRHALPS